MKPVTYALAVAICIAGFAATGQAKTACSAAPASAIGPAINLTPITVRILQDALIPVAATDGLVHLAYAAQITNPQPVPVTVDSVTPVDAAQDFAPTGRNQPLDTDGKPIAGKTRLFAPPDGHTGTGDDSRYFGTIPAGGSGIMFFDVAYADGAPVPALLSHKIVVTDVKSGAKAVGLTDPVPVRCEDPVVLRPPLVGHGWWDANGCCGTVNAHRAATLPIDGDFKPPEQFAIDYAQIGKHGGCCTGPLRDLKSWPFFGAPILAAAAGKVVELVTDMPEQVPGPPVGVTAANAAGNHIIQDIGGGRFVLYAHLRRGSIPGDIKAGTMLKTGQPIGQLGNSGSSTAPHLHFQVMDRPSTLNAVGLPFVFDTQVVEGRVTDTAADAEERYEEGKPVTVETIGPKTVHDRMPAEGQVFSYNVN